MDFCRVVQTINRKQINLKNETENDKRIKNAFDSTESNQLPLVLPLLLLLLLLLLSLLLLLLLLFLLLFMLLSLLLLLCLMSLLLILHLWLCFCV